MVPALVTDSEVEAEVARGMLEANGIDAVVRFSGRSGYPRYIAGSGGAGVGAPLASFEVLVAEGDLDAAREMVSADIPETTGPRTAWRTWVLRAICFLLIAGLLSGAIQQIAALF